MQWKNIKNEIIRFAVCIGACIVVVVAVVNVDVACCTVSGHMLPKLFIFAARVSCVGCRPLTHTLAHSAFLY